MTNRADCSAEPGLKTKGNKMNLFSLYQVLDDVQAVLDDIYYKAEQAGGIVPDYLNNVLESLELRESNIISEVAKDVLNTKARRKAAEDQKEKFEDIISQCEHREDANKKFLAHYLKGSKYSDSCVTISYHTSSSVEIIDESKVPEQYWKIERTIKKTPIREAIESGATIDYAKIVNNRSIQVK